jgi:hypothetical protein
MKFGCLDGLKCRTYDEWAARIEQLRERAATSRMTADSNLHLYRTEAIKFAESLLYSEGFRPGKPIQVMPQWSVNWPNGAEYAWCEFVEHMDQVCIMGFRLNKDGSRTKLGGPWQLGAVTDRANNVSVGSKTPNVNSATPPVA